VMGSSDAWLARAEAVSWHPRNAVVCGARRLRIPAIAAAGVARRSACRPRAGARGAAVPAVTRQAAARAAGTAWRRRRRAGTGRRSGTVGHCRGAGSGPAAGRPSARAMACPAGVAAAVCRPPRAGRSRNVGESETRRQRSGSWSQAGSELGAMSCPGAQVDETRRAGPRGSGSRRWWWCGFGEGDVPRYSLTPAAFCLRSSMALACIASASLSSACCRAAFFSMPACTRSSRPR